MKIRNIDLAAKFWLCLDDDNNKTIKTKLRIAKMIAYMFGVDLDMGRVSPDKPYCFSEEDAKKIEEQTDGVSMYSLTRGEISLDTLLLLTNSPRCPYTLHTDGIWANNKHYFYYHFISKRNIVKDEINLEA